MKKNNTMFLIFVSYGEWDDNNKIPAGVVSTYDEATLVAQDFKDINSNAYQKLCFEMGWDVGYTNFDTEIVELPHYVIE